MHLASVDSGIEVQYNRNPQLSHPISHCVIVNVLQLSVTHFIIKDFKTCIGAHRLISILVKLSTTQTSLGASGRSPNSLVG